MDTPENTQTAIVQIQNHLGLHARPATAFVDVANIYESEVVVRREDEDQAVDGKSIMQMLMLAATQGTNLELEVTGSDAVEALAALVDLINRKFDEPE